MMMKDILVHLDSGPRAEHRLDVALTLAAANGARVTGLFAQSETYAPGLVARRASDTLLGAADRARSLLQAKGKAAGVPVRFWRTAHGEYSHLISEMVLSARYFDLTVLGQHPPEEARAPEEMIEQVALNAGRPVLILPYAGSFPSLAKRVVIAWNGSREAARAVHDALPFLTQADSVTILSVRSGDRQDQGEHDLPRPSVVDYLHSHGIEARHEALTAEDIGAMDLLLSRAFDYSADMLVMGAHGQYALSFLRGSGTKHILKHMTMPVFMSH